MALNNFEGSSTTYLNIADGKLVQRLQEANSSTTERVTKTGKVVHELKFKSVTGVLTNVTVNENDYGKQWHVSLEDEGNKYIITMPYSSRYATSFLKQLPNIDIHTKVTIMPWSMVSKDDASKKITGVTTYQHDIKTAPFYTRENQNGLPQMTKLKVKGQEVWDDSDMLTFLEEMATKLFDKTPF